jgi:hypothetical protein
VSQDPIFCDLIERVKGEGEKRDPFHITPPLSSRAKSGIRKKLP